MKKLKSKIVIYKIYIILENIRFIREFNLETLDKLNSVRYEDFDSLQFINFNKQNTIRIAILI